MKRAVIYTRVSTDEQARNGLSLKGQLDSARSYCLEHDIEIAGEYTDAGESAKTANRPQLNGSLEFCRKNYKDIDFYIVWKMDRLARNALDSALIDATLTKLGIGLVSVTEPFGNTSAGSLMKTMLSAFAQFDNDVRGERSTAGAKRRIEEGGWPYLAPLGYKNCKDNLRRPTLLISDQATLIAKWLRSYLSGRYNLAAMNQLAWQMGIRSRNGKRLPNQQTINMLRNPVYSGYVFSKMIDTPIKGLHEGLITLAEHKAILDKIDSHKRPANGIRTSVEWPLRGGFLKCNECGSSMTGSSPRGRTKKYPMYHCPKCRVKIVGHKVSVGRDELHRDFEKLLETITPSDANIKLFKYMVLKKWHNLHKEQRTYQQQLQQSLTDLRGRKQRVVSLFIDGNLSVLEKLDQTKSIDADILRTDLKLNETNSEVIDTDVLIDFGINMIQNATKMWKIADENEQQLLQLAIFPDGLTYDFVKGFGTIKTSELYEVVRSVENKKSNLVGLDRVELSTKWL